MELNDAIKKIQKCLALASSSSENEAATAMRQAQKLMEAYNISEKDLSLAEYADVSIGLAQQPSKKVPLWAASLMQLIEDTFGVKAVYTATPAVGGNSFYYKLEAVYFGPKHRVELAKYTHAVLVRNMNKSWKERQFMYEGQRNARTSFFIGWLAKAGEKVAKMALTEQEEVLVTESINRKFGKVGSVDNSKRMNNIDDSLVYEGFRNAENFDIHKPMGGETHKKLG